jgi:hypothetical protein
MGITFSTTKAEVVELFVTLRGYNLQKLSSDGLIATPQPDKCVVQVSHAKEHHQCRIVGWLGPAK